MGYAFYEIANGRFGGYGVLATCDKRGCENEIDRGLGYLCGDSPHHWLDDDPGCGFYFCEEHLSWVGPRGGCSHHQKQAWGKTLSDLVPSPTDGTYCLGLIGHDGPHAWALSDVD